jgi:D-glycero-alpha-D-manno-heptose 1-phosphate guanylyltransferase
LAGLYPHLPKPLIPVAGKPFLHWLVAWFQGQGISDFVFSIGYKAEQIEKWISETPLLTPATARARRETTPLGTGGGVRACLDECVDSVMVTNGDSLILTSLAPTIESFQRGAGGSAMIVGKKVADASRYASLSVDADGRLTGYREKTPGSGLISAGIYFFRKELLLPFDRDVPLSMEYDIMPRLLDQGVAISVLAAPDNAPFIDIGTPETSAQADSFIHDYFPF